MPQDSSAQIAKAKALARAMGLPESEVIKLALEQTSGDPRLQNQAKAGLAALHGQPEGIHTIDAGPLQRPDPWADLPQYEGDETRFNVSDLQAEAIEHKNRKQRGSTVSPSPFSLGQTFPKQQ